MCSQSTVAGGARRGLPVFSQMHRKSWAYESGGDSYVLGEGQRRTAALCAGAVNRRFMSLLFTFEDVSLACGHEGIASELRRGILPGWICSWSRLNHRTADELSGANSFSFRKNFRKSSLCPILHWVLEANVSIVCIIDLSLGLNYHQERK